MFYSLYHIAVEKKPSPSSSEIDIPFLSLIVILPCFLLNKVPKWVKKLHKCISGNWSCFQCQLLFGHGDSVCCAPKDQRNEPTHCHNQVGFSDEMMGGGEMTVVMEKLGIISSREIADEGEKVEEKFGPAEFASLFDEMEPSLEEVKEAFDVFDMNRDGFIDAWELQRVLRALGLKEGEELESCSRMIGSYDLNNDGRLDFQEFLRFMEAIFC